MSQSLVNNLIHLVYSTKHREPWIPKEFKDGLYAYQAGIFKQWDSPAIIIGGIEDHVHAVVSIPPRVSVARFTGQLTGARDGCRGPGAAAAGGSVSSSQAPLLVGRLGQCSSGRRARLSLFSWVRWPVSASCRRCTSRTPRAPSS